MDLFERRHHRLEHATQSPAIGQGLSQWRCDDAFAAVRHTNEALHAGNTFFVEPHQHIALSVGFLLGGAHFDNDI